MLTNNSTVRAKSASSNQHLSNEESSWESTQSLSEEQQKNSICSSFDEDNLSSVIKNDVIGEEMELDQLISSDSRKKQEKHFDMKSNSKHKQVDGNNSLLKQLQLSQTKLDEKEKNISKLLKGDEMNIGSINAMSKSLGIDITKYLNEIQEQKLIIENYVKREKCLSKLLGMDNRDSDVVWERAYEKIQSVNSLTDQVKRLESEKKSLNNDLEIVMHELNSRESQKEVQEQTNDKLKNALQALLANEREQNAKNSRIITKLQAKILYTNTISNILHKTMRQIDSLHSALCKADQINMKSLIFLVITMRQFVNRKVTDFGDNIINVLCKNRSENNVEKKIKDLRKKFTYLTEDLIHAQAELKISEERRIKDKALLTEYQNLNISSTDVSTKYKRKCKAYKRKIEDQRREINSMINPALYESTVKSLDEETSRSLKNKERIAKLEGELEIINKEYDDSKREVKDVQIALNTSKFQINKLNEASLEKDQELELMKTVLKNKTGDILSLERQINVHSLIQSKRDLEVRALVVENEMKKK